MEIDRLMTEDLMFLDMTCTDKEDCIRQMADALFAAGRIKDKEGYVNAVLEREKIGPTGIGMQSAIPHGKSAAVEIPSLAFARCDVGVDFQAQDHSLANLVFLIAVPETTADLHLKMLGELARSLVHADFREKILKAETKQEILSILRGGN